LFVRKIKIIFVEPGQAVKADDIIAKIETDKVTVDILAKFDGVVTKYHCEEGDTVPVGAPFVDIDPDAKAGATPAAAPKKEQPAAPKVTEKF
jgi:2-oxoglutarate dehydrogenase E2 component (dihydrolipoamide succinyltransferase)